MELRAVSRREVGHVGGIAELCVVRGSALDGGDVVRGRDEVDLVDVVRTRAAVERISLQHELLACDEGGDGVGPGAGQLRHSLGADRQIRGGPGRGADSGWREEV